MDAIELVYLGHDNEIDLVLLSDAEPVSLAAITRVTLRLGDTLLDSDQLGFGAGQPFDTTVTRLWKGEIVDILRLALGAAGVAAGLYRARLVTYDPDHPNGLVWTEALRVKVTT